MKRGQSGQLAGEQGTEWAVSWGQSGQLAGEQGTEWAVSWGTGDRVGS